MQGEPYIVEADGIPRVPSDDELAVYAIVTPFVADITRQIGPATCTELVGSVLPALLPNAQGMYALTLTGNLSWALGRSFLGWEPPNPNAAVLAAEGQVIFDQTNVNGAIIAYYMPQAVDGFCRLGAFCAQTGFHTHYISGDRQQGGHLLDCAFDGGTLEITTLRELRLHTPDGSVESFFAPR
jgi:acetolactate decarboxylase